MLDRFDGSLFEYFLKLLLLTFIQETTMAGYEKLLETSVSYRDDVGEINRMMAAFATESEEVKDSIDNIKDAMEAIDVAVEESAKGIGSVTEVSVDLATTVMEIGKEAEVNMDIAQSLNAEVNKFKLN